MDTPLRKSFLHLFIMLTIATQGDIFKLFYKNNYKFCDMRTIRPTIFPKLDFFATIPQMGVAYSALKKI